jgi:hypothetical protein
MVWIDSIRRSNAERESPPCSPIQRAAWRLVSVILAEQDEEVDDRKDLPGYEAMTHTNSQHPRSQIRKFTEKKLLYRAASLP